MTKPDHAEPFSSMIQTVHGVAYHRNGVGGCPFYVVSFSSRNTGEEMVGIVFSEPEDGDEMAGSAERRVAVMNRELLGKGIIAFGANSYRGDKYTHCLLKAIRDRNTAEAEKFRSHGA